MQNNDSDLTIGVFTEGLDEETYARRCLEPFAKGVMASGDKCEVHRGLQYQPCDVAVIFGDVRDAPAKHERMRLKAEVKGRHIHRGLIVIDTPVLMRATPNGESFRRVGLDAIHHDVGTFPSGASEQRWKHLSAHHDIAVKRSRSRGDKIYVLLQRPQDASLRGSQGRRPANYMTWLRDTLVEIRRQTSRQILIRPHPASRRDPVECRWLQVLATNMNVANATLDCRDISIQEVLNDAWATVTFNSGSAIDSLLAGVPTVACDSGSFAWPVAEHSVTGIDNISLIDLDAWLNDLAYVDWSLGELASGEAWRHIKPSIEQVV